MNTGIVRHFPSHAPRPFQVEALEFFEQNDRKFSIFELPTGSGKSHIAWSAISWEREMYETDPDIKPGGYILTPQKTLTAQYMRDFERLGLAELRGKASYRCQANDVLDCEVASDVIRDHNKVCQGFVPARRRFLNSAFSVTNYDCFLMHGFPARQLLVLDEGHNVETKILDHVSSRVTRNHGIRYGLEVPVFQENDLPRVGEWLEKIYVPSLARWIEHYVNEIEKYRRKLSDDEQREVTKMIKEKNFLERRVANINIFLQDKADDWFVRSDEKTGDLILKPLTCVRHVNRMLFDKPEEVIIMSSTILDAAFFARSLGIRDEDFAFHAWPSSFPVENRPLFYWPVGNMGHRWRAKTIKALVKRVVKIVEKFPNDKGIIHAQSYENVREIWQGLQDAGLGPRVLTHHTPQGRAEALHIHLTAPAPTVLLSPSMAEGLDLPDDLSRFQVIVKVPYPNLGDPYIRSRQRRSHDWYAWATAAALVQATGRSVRSDTDQARTYILDSEFSNFMARNSSLLPQWWRDAITRG